MFSYSEFKHDWRESAYPYKEPISKEYKVWVNGKEVPVYTARISKMSFNTVWPGHQRDAGSQTTLASFVNLVSDEELDIKVLPNFEYEKIMIKPYSKNEVEEVVGEFLHKLLAEEEGGMWIDTSDGKIKVQYNNILYLEASNKMLSLRLNSMEYNIYGSLDKFEKSLPDSFVRCHRSYIVNGTFISKVRFSENYLVLNNQIQIPLSRTYKQAIRGLMSNGHNEKEILS